MNTRSWVLPVYRSDSKYLEVSSDNRLPVRNHAENLFGFKLLRISDQFSNIKEGVNTDRPSISGVLDFINIRLDIFSLFSGSIEYVIDGLLLDENGDIIKSSTLSSGTISVLQDNLYVIFAENSYLDTQYFFNDIRIMLKIKTFTEGVNEVYVRVVGIM